MSWTITQTGEGNLAQIAEGFRRLDGAEVKYGWTEDSADYPDGTSIHMVAAVHHFGKTIEDGFGRGIQINIPARPILTETFERQSEQIAVLSEALNDEILATGTNDIEPALTVIGQFAVSNMDQDFLRAQGDLVPLKPRTIAAKGHDLKLIGTKTDRSPGGHLRSQVKFKVNTSG